MSVLGRLWQKHDLMICAVSLLVYVAPSLVCCSCGRVRAWLSSWLLCSAPCIVLGSALRKANTNRYGSVAIVTGMVIWPWRWWSHSLWGFFWTVVFYTLRLLWTVQTTIT